MDETELQRMFYRPFCSEEEIDRIVEVQNVEDHLLRLRADIVADHTRLLRVMMARRRRAGGQWSFSAHFSKREFDVYLQSLDVSSRDACSSLARGFIFSNEPEALCIRTDFGDLVLVSEALRYFLYYMNMCYLDLGYEVPEDVRLHAQVIAIRTMLKSEAMDFDLDPRGIVPQPLHDELVSVVYQQLQYVIGHEYSHYLLGHLDEKRTVLRPLFRAFRGENEGQPLKTYGNTQQQELDADVDALLRPRRNDGSLMYALGHAVAFFVYLDVYRSVSDSIFPRSSLEQSHPDPLDRLEHVHAAASERIGSQIARWDDLLATASALKERLARDVARNIEAFENYGSVYLGQWRGPVLVDRVDY